MRQRGEKWYVQVMTKFIVAVALVVLFLPGCKKKSSEEVPPQSSESTTTEESVSGKEEVLSTYESGAKRETGIFRGKDTNRVQLKGFEYYETGERKREFSYKDNLYYGRWTFWYKDGKVMAEGNFTEKVLDPDSASGSGIYYWPNGQKMIEIETLDPVKGATVVAVYSEAGRKYRPRKEPPELREKIDALIKKWQDGEV